MSRSRGWALGLALVAATLAGCIGQAEHIDREIRVVDGAADPDDPRAEDEYWMVWIRGNETEERKHPFVCSRLPPDYRLEPPTWTLVYDNESYAFEPEEVATMLAFDHEDRSSQCPEAEHLVANPADEHVEVMGEYGPLALSVRTDGTLVVDGHEVPLGKAAEVTYEGTPADADKLHVEGGFRVENLGAWPHAHLQEGEP